MCASHATPGLAVHGNGVVTSPLRWKTPKAGQGKQWKPPVSDATSFGIRQLQFRPSLAAEILSRLSALNQQWRWWKGLELSLLLQK